MLVNISIFERIVLTVLFLTFACTAIYLMRKWPEISSSKLPIEQWPRGQQIALYAFLFALITLVIIVLMIFVSGLRKQEIELSIKQEPVNFKLTYITAGLNFQTETPPACEQGTETCDEQSHTFNLGTAVLLLSAAIFVHELFIRAFPIHIAGNTSDQ